MRITSRSRLRFLRAAMTGFIALTYPLPASRLVAFAGDRPALWAAPITLPGVPNLHQVTDRLYRSAQPEAAGFRNLATRLGIKTVISLRQTVDDAPLVEGTALLLHQVPIKTWHIGDDQSQQIVEALRQVRAGLVQGPVLLHCTHGADRTGMIIALYRMLYQGWSREAATTEMTDGQFGFHAIWTNIPAYLRKVDLDALQRRVDAPG